MAVVKWRGDAPAVAQVNTITPASVTIGNIFTLTINGKTVTFTATAATVANVTAGLAAAVAASLTPEFQEVTAADNTTTLTLTSNVAGRPFTQTSSSATGSGSGGHSLSTSTTTANSGPNNWDVAANWSGGAVPVNSDDVYIENSTVDILYGLAQSAVTLASLNIAQSFTGRIGLPLINETGTYYEYRARYLNIKATTVKIGYGDGSGSGRLLLDLDANATTILVTNTGNPLEQAVPALCIEGSGSTYTPTILGGSVGIAVETSQTATLDTLTVTGQAVVTCGSGCTITTIAQSGGVLTTNSAVTTFGVDGASVATIYAGAITTLNVDGGTVNYRSTGTITTLRVGTNGAIDFTADTRARTVTNCTIESSAKITDTYKTVTWTNGVVLNRCSLAEVSIDLGTNLTILVSSPPVMPTGSYTATIGDGVATSYTISQATHGLAPNGALAAFVYNASTGLQEFPSVTINNGTGAVTLVFSSAPASNAKRVVILGATA
jgi:hypothetical protein